MKISGILMAVLIISVFACHVVVAQGASEEELAKAAQNPVASMISLPFQNNTNFEVGAKGKDAERAQYPAGLALLAE